MQKNLYKEESKPVLSDAMSELFRRAGRRNYRPMKTLKEIFPDILAVQGSLNIVPTELTCDSRRVGIGSVFFAVEGNRADGHRYIQDAISRGAVAIVSERALERLPVTTLQVPSIRHAIADAARRYWGMPDRKLQLIGVTGTKGKTTLTYLTRYLLKAAKVDCGMLSTVENDLGQRSMPAYRTTPDAIDLAGYLAQMVEGGCSHAVMEVSSHGITQGRVSGIKFELAVWTNLTHEHLDYHGTMEQYYQAKASLFKGATGAKPKLAVINLDDAYGQRLYGEIHESVETITYGSLPACDVQIEASHSTRSHSQYTLKLGNRRYNGTLPMVGAHNISNAVGALAVAYAMGISVKDSVAALQDFAGVPGRLEKIERGQAWDVIVDYAHTQDAMRCTLQALRPLCSGRLITVFGCGGNRDQDKRARMTTTAMQGSDITIATSDNPRREALEDIFAMMKMGIVGEGHIEFIASRRQAIAKALQMAGPQDCVLILGKGHETYQEFADAIVPFDDRQVAREILANMGYSGPISHDSSLDINKKVAAL